MHRAAYPRRASLQLRAFDKGPREDGVVPFAPPTSPIGCVDLRSDITQSSTPASEQRWDPSSPGTADLVKALSRVDPTYRILCGMGTRSRSVT